jgi:hypothetical protein
VAWNGLSSGIPVPNLKYIKDERLIPYHSIIATRKQLQSINFLAIFNMRSSTVLIALTSSLLSPGVKAHGFVRGVTVNGQWTAGSDPVWYYLPANSKPVTAGWDALNQDNGFVEPAAMGTADVNCHKSATPGKNYINVNAGEKINFYWKYGILNSILPQHGH